MSQDHQLSLLNPLSGRESRVRASKDEGFSVSFITENQARLLEVVPEPAASTMSSLVNAGLHPANIVGSTKDLRLCAGTKSKRMTFIVLKDISALGQHQEIDVVVGQDSSEQYTDLLGMAEQRCIAVTQTRKLTPQDRRRQEERLAEQRRQTEQREILERADRDRQRALAQANQLSGVSKEQSPASQQGPKR